MGAPPVVMFLSTGRCGTQWLTASITELYPDVAVEHEPIGPLYAPRRYFRRYDDPAAILDVPEVAAHLRRIERADRPYIETGWPLFAALPLLAERIPERLRVVHLTRHPVPTALSHLAHSSYAGSPRNDAYTRLATLAPSDRGVFQPEYAQTWDGLSPYEKCLFWWTQVGMFGLEFPGRVDWVPFHRVQAERIRAGDQDELEQLLAFMDLPWDDGWLVRATRTVDRWHPHADRDVNPLEVHRHPVTAEVAFRLGYDVAELNVGELLARYQGEPDPDLDRVGRYA